MDYFKWGVVGNVEKAKLFLADLPNANGRHLLHAFVNSGTAGDALSIEVPQVLPSLLDLLQTDVDAVYIASPFQHHYAQVKQCLLHGKPVLCERPITANATELKHLMQLSEHNRVFMMEAMWIRFLPSIKKVLSIISSGAIGEIVSVKASVAYLQSAETKREEVGEELLFDLGIYPVFLSTLLLGKPQYVQASGQLKEGGTNDFFSAFLSYEGGQFAFIETTKHVRGTSAATITGDKGLIHIKNPWSKKPEGIEVDFFDGTKVLHKSEWEGYGLQFELDEVRECVQNNEIESQLYCQHFNLDVMETMDDIRQQII